MVRLYSLSDEVVDQRSSSICAVITDSSAAAVPSREAVPENVWEGGKGVAVGAGGCGVSGSATATHDVP